jgi:hypothetical protein
MKAVAIAFLLFALAACSPGSQALLYCLAVDHNPNLKCQ